MSMSDTDVGTDSDDSVLPAKRGYGYVEDQVISESETFADTAPYPLSHHEDQVDDTPEHSSSTRYNIESPLFETALMSPMMNTTQSHFESNSTSPPPSPTPVDGLRRARAIKNSISTSLTIRKSTHSARKRVEDDPENHLIKSLRQEHGMGWGAIADYLNNERIQRGEPATLTGSAVYSRFVRNGPRIANVLGEIGFDPKDYMHLRNPVQRPAAEGRRVVEMGFGIGAGRKRVRYAGNEEQELRGSLRQKASLVEQTRELEEDEMTELLADAVATVQRNFWKLVADELERTGSRLYDPQACESRYHAI